MPRSMVTCEICQRDFKRREHLERHRLGVHGLGVRLQCGLCALTFVRKTHLLRHQRNKHPQDESVTVASRRVTLTDSSVAAVIDAVVGSTSSSTRNSSTEGLADPRAAAAAKPVICPLTPCSTSSSDETSRSWFPSLDVLDNHLRSAECHSAAVVLYSCNAVGCFKVIHTARLYFLHQILDHAADPPNRAYTPARDGEGVIQHGFLCHACGEIMRHTPAVLAQLCDAVVWEAAERAAASTPENSLAGRSGIGSDDSSSISDPPSGQNGVLSGFHEEGVIENGESEEGRGAGTPSYTENGTGNPQRSLVISRVELHGKTGRGIGLNVRYDVAACDSQKSSQSLTAVCSSDATVAEKKPRLTVFGPEPDLPVPLIGPVNLNAVKCPVCKVELTTQKAMHEHLFVFHDAPDTVWECWVCGGSFECLRSLSHHLNHQHFRIHNSGADSKNSRKFVRTAVMNTFPGIPTALSGSLSEKSKPLPISKIGGNDGKVTLKLAEAETYVHFHLCKCAKDVFARIDHPHGTLSKSRPLFQTPFESMSNSPVQHQNGLLDAGNIPDSDSIFLARPSDPAADLADESQSALKLERPVKIDLDHIADEVETTEMDVDMSNSNVICAASPALQSVRPDLDSIIDGVIGRPSRQSLSSVELPPMSGQQPEFCDVGLPELQIHAAEFLDDVWDDSQGENRVEDRHFECESESPREESHVGSGAAGPNDDVSPQRETFSCNPPAERSAVTDLDRFVNSFSTSKISLNSHPLSLSKDSPASLTKCLDFDTHRQSSCSTQKRVKSIKQPSFQSSTQTFSRGQNSGAQQETIPLLSDNFMSAVRATAEKAVMDDGQTEDPDAFVEHWICMVCYCAFESRRSLLAHFHPDKLQITNHDFFRVRISKLVGLVNCCFCPGQGSNLVGDGRRRSTQQLKIIPAKTAVAHMKHVHPKCIAHRYLCRTCGDELASADDRQYHAVFNHKVTAPRASQGGISVQKRILARDRHLKQKNGTFFMCILCRFWSTGYGLLVGHVLREHMDGPGVDNDLHGKKTLVLPNGRDKRDMIRRHLCLICGLTFADVTQVESHLRHHSDDDQLMAAKPLSLTAYCSFQTVVVYKARPRPEGVFDKTLAVLCETCGEEVEFADFVRDHIFGVHLLGNMNAAHAAGVNLPLDPLILMHSVDSEFHAQKSCRICRFLFTVPLNAN